MANELNELRTAKDRAAIVGIAHTHYSRNLGMTEQQAALKVIREACAEAGLKTSEIEAIYKVDLDSNNEGELARSLGVKNLRAWGSAGWGGGAAAAPVVMSTMAIATGMADVAVAFRARNRSTGGRPWAANNRTRIYGNTAFEVPYGMQSPVQQIAIATRRYMHRFGVTSEDLARVCVVQRENAVPNPHAVFRDPITVDDVLNSRMIADPLHLLDCCPETDGACAAILTTVERARDLRQPPVVVSGIAQGTGGKGGARMVQVYEEDPSVFPGEWASQDLYRMAGVGPKEIDVAMLYDMFSPVVLWQLESWGFCKRGEGGEFVRAGEIAAGGSIPINTHGGSLSEAYIHGFNHVIEGVRQVRGTSTRQVANVNYALVAAAPVVPTSAVLLRRA